MSKLYELSGQYNKVWDMVNDESDLQMIQDTLESIEGEIEEKALNIGKLLKVIESDIPAIKAEEERLFNKRKALENRAESIKKYFEANLINMGIDKVKTDLFTFTIQNNPPSVKIVDESKLFTSYFITQPAVVDKKAILKDLKNGINVNGAELQQTKSIRIR